MGYFPFFVDIAGRRGVVVGGGKVAARKVEKLLPFGPRLTVVAPKIEACIRTQKNRLTGDALTLQLVERELEMTDLDGADFVIAATDDETLNGRISDYCKSNQILVNVVDDKEKCSFFFPALVRRGNLTVGISTDGKSPGAASWVRRRIAETLPSGIGDAIDLMGQIRPRVMELDLAEEERKDILERMFLYSLEKDGEVTLEELERRTVRAASKEKSFPARLKKIRIGTRGSRLALQQAALVQEALLQAEDGIETEIVVVHTKGDKVQDKPFSEIGDKGVFASELEQALLNGRIDLAVHSAKDLPMRLAQGLDIAAVLPRGDVRDVLVVPKGGRTPVPVREGLEAGRPPGAFESLEKGAETPGKAGGGSFVIGTGSRRRQTLAGQMWENVVCETIRGNVDTRLQKLKYGGGGGIVYDGILLAKAGLDRLDMISRYEGEFDFYPLSPEAFLPAACQGIIVAEAVRGSQAAARCREITDAETEFSFLVEREVLERLSADCSEAAAAWCRRMQDGQRQAVAGAPDEWDEWMLDVMYAGNRHRLAWTAASLQKTGSEEGGGRLLKGLQMAKEAAAIVKTGTLRPN